MEEEGVLASAERCFPVAWRLYLKCGREGRRDGWREGRVVQRMEKWKDEARRMREGGWCGFGLPLFFIWGRLVCVCMCVQYVLKSSCSGEVVCLCLYQR